MVFKLLSLNIIRQKNSTVSCTVNVSELQMIASLRLFPQTHSLRGGLGYVHIGQVGRSELSAYTQHT